MLRASFQEHILLLHSLLHLYLKHTVLWKGFLQGWSSQGGLKLDEMSSLDRRESLFFLFFLSFGLSVITTSSITSTLPWTEVVPCSTFKPASQNNEFQAFKFKRLTSAENRVSEVWKYSKIVGTVWREKVVLSPVLQNRISLLLYLLCTVCHL